MKNETADIEQYSIPMIVIVQGDSKDAPMRLLLQRLATLTMSDMYALWQEIGIDTKHSLAMKGAAPQGFSYPELYNIMSLINFEYEAHYDEVPRLLDEAEQAEIVVHSEEAKRALSVIIEVSRRAVASGRGLSYRPSLILPPQTTVLP